MSTDKNPTSEILHLLEKAYELRGIDMHESMRLSEKALKKSRKLEIPSLIAKSLSRLSLFHMISAKNDMAIEMAEEAIKYFRLENDELGVANAKYTIGGVYYKTNNYHLGMFHLIDSLTIFEKYNDKHNESKTHKSLGTIYEILGDQTNAITAYEKAIRCALEIKNKNLESNAYNPLSGIYLKQGKIQEALDIAEKSILLKQETGDTRGYAYAIYGRGKVLTNLEKYKDALKDFTDALAIHQNVGDIYGISMCYYKMAKLYIQSSDRKKGKKYLKKAIALSTKNNLALMKYKCFYFMYTIYKEEGEKIKALNYLEKYLSEKDTAVNSQTLKVIENYERVSKIQSKENELKLERQKEKIRIKQERAEQEAQMKQNFLSAMSHEIRTPLNAITGIISLLQDSPSPNKEDKKLLTSLRFSAKNLMRIINDILDFSKLESDKMMLEEHPSKFKELLKNIQQTYIGLAIEKGIDLTLSVGPKVSDAYIVDETKLFQILGNLISNAIKFTTKGSVAIIVDLVSTTKNKDLLSFQIKDTGKGIPEKEQERLFESFYVPKSVMTRNDGGTGLGLAIVKKIIELHGSSIDVVSLENVGSTFFFNLELEQTTVPVATDTEVFEKLENKVAILADDNEINALVMSKLLSKWGITMKRAKNGKEAVEIAGQEKVDYILMDIHMPLMNGFDATRVIRTTENPNKNTAIYALTADVTAANEHENATYFSGFLWKPVEIKRLFEALTNTAAISGTT